mmetsp:Transcript_8800/g.20778  ORF Transcript_8800/g.20778 Transcript_8800/m.20778 type:complete len:105 (+) Transcript_8800:245-559(+)
MLDQLDKGMRWRIARQRGWYQRQLNRRKIPKYCEWSSRSRLCPLCRLPFGVGHMLVQAHLADGTGTPPEWVHVKCAQHLITGEGYEDVLRWRQPGGEAGPRAEP